MNPKAECPTCKQDITFEYKEGMVHQCESKLKELTENVR